MNTQNQTLDFDVSQAEDVVCSSCGGSIFREVALIKRVSPLVSPTGKETFVPIGTFACVACNHINDQFHPFRRPTE